MHEASRTLLKSPPELWAECSDATSLNRHLDSFGEIRITRLEPETAVAWEGDTASGTVRLEPSGWGTRVILTAEGAVVAEEETVAIGDGDGDGDGPLAVEPELVEPEAVEPEPVEPQPVQPEPVLEAQPEPAPPEPVVPAPRGGFLARIKAWMRGPEPLASESASEPVASDPTPEPVASYPTPGPARDPETVGQAVPEVEPVVSVGDRVAPKPVESDPAPAEPVLISAPEAEGAAEAQVVVEPRAAVVSVADRRSPVDALTHALDSLGMAHHRPFSRS